MVGTRTESSCVGHSTLIVQRWPSADKGAGRSVTGASSREESHLPTLCRSKIGFGLWLGGVLTVQAACWYSFIRPLRMGLRWTWCSAESAMGGGLAWMSGGR